MKPNSRFNIVSALKPEPETMASAAKILRAGGVVAFPTTGLYGLGADALNPVAVEKIFRIKQRDFGKPILILIRDGSDLSRIVIKIPATAKKMMTAFWET